jgi:hypothetical protein
MVELLPSVGGAGDYTIGDAADGFVRVAEPTELIGDAL